MAEADTVHRCESDYADVIRAGATVTWRYCPYCGVEFDSDFHSVDTDIDQ